VANRRHAKASRYLEGVIARAIVNDGYLVECWGTYFVHQVPNNDGQSRRGVESRNDEGRWLHPAQQAIGSG
jgi:hypothetical protein